MTAAERGEIATGLQKNRRTLAVVAIAKNEERDLPGFLANVLALADEVIIVDDGSTDQTAAIAQSAGPMVRFVVAPKQDGEGFCDQRNKGIDLATSDWLLHMDIDERISPELATEIRRAIDDDRLDAYRYRRLNFLLHRPMRGGGWERWNNVQLARRDVLRFVGALHESAKLTCPPERIGQLEGRMWHLNDESWLERMDKSARYCAIEGQRLANSGKRVRWYHLIARPAMMFVKTFVLLRGYRDGLMGLILAGHNTAACFAWHVVAWDAQNRIPREAVERRVQTGTSEPCQRA